MRLVPRADQERSRVSDELSFEFGPSSWERIAFNAELSMAAPSDPEDSLMIALTRKEGCLVMFGCEVLARFIPELSSDIMELFKKIAQLSDAQGWLDLETRQERDLFDLDNNEDLT